MNLVGLFCGVKGVAVHPFRLLPSNPCQEEYAEENFFFWQSAEQFASSLPTVAKAQTLYDGYIREGAPKQVSVVI